jgi:hypothetical protein
MAGTILAGVVRQGLDPTVEKAELISMLIPGRGAARADVRARGEIQIGAARRRARPTGLYAAI